MYFLISTKGRIIKAGKILHKSPIAPNILIAKISSYIEEGTVIYDSSGKRIGVAIETFGPTNSPYLRIRIDNDVLIDSLEGKNIFVIENVKERVTWKKRKKRRKKYGK